MRTGWTAFDSLGLARPGRFLLLDVAAPQGHRLTMDLLAGSLAGGGRAVVVDGSNWLDVYRLGEAAERHGLTRLEAALGVRVARAFTAHQLQTLVEDALPDLLRNASFSLVLAPGFPDLHQDEDLTPAESRALFARAARALRRHAEEHGVAVVATSWTLPPGRRTHLRLALEKAAHDRLALLHAPHEGLRLKLPDRPALLAPEPFSRQRTLDDFGAAAPVHGPPGTYAVLVPPHPALRYVARRAGEDRSRRKAVAE